ncbi:MAG: ABC transporter permease [Candidatus Rokuibacteriota bacterium]|nr:MAG: ABC transporter permease [Candidatus Rokubacteria bacterium]PYO00937.1 MAG: ABC transporter permease [Candidatus Rokubacteria bacterium]
MLAPALLYIVLLVAVPFLLAVFLSLTNSSAGSLEFSFVGLQNFKNVMASPVFQRALRNTFTFTLISQVTVIFLGNVLARALLKRFRGKSLARFLILMPWAAPISLATLGWLWIFDSTFSVINWLLKVAGWLGPGQWYYWLGDPTLGMVAIITVHVWRMLPFSTVILLAGLTSIPNEVHEAADLDGAGPLGKTIWITIPMMLPILTVALLFGVVFTFTDMSVVYLLTRGGPYNSTHVLASLAFQDGVLGGDVGRGASVAIFLLPVLVILAVTMLRVSRRAEVA